MKILFLCTGNSCRSQMAEGWARALKSDRFEAFSAGTVAHGLNPSAVKVMADAGVDISGHHSKTVEDVRDGALTTSSPFAAPRTIRAPSSPAAARSSTTASMTRPRWPKAPRAKRKLSPITCVFVTRSRRS